MLGVAANFKLQLATVQGPHLLLFLESQFGINATVISLWEFQIRKPKLKTHSKLQQY